MEQVSVFDIFKIGIGPSSSHTMGPWRAALAMVEKCKNQIWLPQIHTIQVDLYGSLALTGKGHGTDFAVLMGLLGYDPSLVSQELVDEMLEKMHLVQEIEFTSSKSVQFSAVHNITFWNETSLPFHPNGMQFHLIDSNGVKIETVTYYSVGGGFIVEKNTAESEIVTEDLPYPIHRAKDLIHWNIISGLSLPEIIALNEKRINSGRDVTPDLIKIWDVMLESIYNGCHTEGILPGGLNLARRAAKMNKRIMTLDAYEEPKSWSYVIKKTSYSFAQTLQWVNSFALGVNEQNASYGRVVTAPTNGAAGVIPAVLMYAMCLTELSYSKKNISDFLLVAGQIGILYKNGATISAAMGGCQAEIGVSSSMAAAGLTHIMGGTPSQVCMAAEIAMEHHLGLTCDPVNGLVQIPCIERNSIGAIKAITAAQLALDGDPSQSKVSLDQIIKTMWETAQDMNNKYKETSQAGLAITLNQPEC